jgi:hypothetical protein
MCQSIRLLFRRLLFRRLLFRRCRPADSQSP